MVLIESLQFPLHCRNTLLPTFLGYFWQANQRPQYVDAIVFPKQSDRQRWSELPIQRSDKYVEDSMFKIGFDAVLDIPSHRGHMNDQSAAAILSQRASEKFGAPLWISECFRKVCRDFAEWGVNRRYDGLGSECCHVS